MNEDKILRTDVDSGLDRSSILSRDSGFIRGRTDIVGLVLGGNFSSTSAGEALGVATKLIVLGWTDPVTRHVIKAVTERVEELASKRVGYFKLEYTYDYRYGDSTSKRTGTFYTYAKNAARAQELFLLKNEDHRIDNCEIRNIVELTDISKNKFYLSEAQLTNEILEKEEEEEKRQEEETRQKMIEYERARKEEQKAKRSRKVKKS
jgi:hypothetical protein